MSKKPRRPTTTRNTPKRINHKQIRRRILLTTKNLVMAVGVLKTIVLFQLLTGAAVVTASGPNLAFGRPAKQSSTLGDAVAMRAVDANNDGDFFHHSCSHTKDGPGGPNWWMVDLGRPYRIRKVVVTNRKDCCGYRLDYVIVGVTNSAADPVRGKYPVCNQYPSTALTGSRMTIECVPNTEPGRYLIIQQPSYGAGFLTLCGVEVYA